MDTVKANLPDTDAVDREFLLESPAMRPGVSDRQLYFYRFHRRVVTRGQHIEGVEYRFAVTQSPGQIIAIGLGCDRQHKAEQLTRKRKAKELVRNREHDRHRLLD
jgi:hypothetical protein